MKIQRLRTLTTNIFHTKIEHVYQDLEAITGEKGLSTHMIPNAIEAIKPWLRQHVTDERFWNQKYDPSHTGDIDLPEPTDEDRAAMFERFVALGNPLKGCEVIAVKI